MTACLINGSLRGAKASSLAFLNEIAYQLDEAGYAHRTVAVKPRVEEGYDEETMRTIAEADALVFVFPIFVYALPGAFMRLLEDYYAYASRPGAEKRKDARVYAVVNCGFVDSQVTEEAIRVMRNFAKRLGLAWRFAISLGCGPVSAMALRLPLLGRKARREFRSIPADLEDRERGVRETIVVDPFIPRAVLVFIRENLIRKKTPASGARQR